MHEKEAWTCKGVHAALPAYHGPHNLGMFLTPEFLRVGNPASLGYATPTLAARIGLDGMEGRENWCEWLYSCYGRNARMCLNHSIARRHRHTGYMSWYKERALPLVRYAIEHEEEPELASWF